MARPKKLATPELAEKAKAELEKIPSGKLAVRLNAIAASAQLPVATVCQVVGITPPTLFQWIKRFRENGREGLSDFQKGHRRRKLDDRQLDQIGRWIESGCDPQGDKVHWTLERLIVQIEQEFGVTVGCTPLWRLLRLRGYVIKVPRPSHAQADPKQQKAFKKKRLK